MQSTADNLQRIRELAVQAANASNSASDRASLNNEATALINEIDRVAQNTSFNGVNLLDGTFNAQTFQVGANGTANDRVTVNSISSARIASLGVGASASYSTSITSATVGGAGLSAGDISINGYQVGATTTDGVSSASATGSAIAVAAAINAITGNTGVTAAVGTTTATGGNVNAGTSISAGGLTVNGVDVGAVATTGGSAAFGANIAAAVNKFSSVTGVTATTNNSGVVTLTAADGRNIAVGGANAASGGFATATTTAKVTLTSTGSSGVNIGGTAGGATASGLTQGFTAATASASSGVSTLDISTAAGA